MSSSCVTSLFLLRLFFCLSASLGLIRPAVESGSPGKHSRVWPRPRQNETQTGGGGGASWGGQHFRPFSPRNTLSSLEHWQDAATSLCSLSHSFPPTFISFLLSLLSLSLSDSFHLGLSLSLLPSLFFLLLLPSSFGPLGAD